MLNFCSSYEDTEINDGELVEYRCFNGMRSVSDLSFRNQTATCTVDSNGYRWDTPNAWEMCTDTKMCPVPPEIEAGGTIHARSTGNRDAVQLTTRTLGANRVKLWNNLGARALEVQTCLKTPNLTGNRFWERFLDKNLSVELHPRFGAVCLGDTRFLNSTDDSGILPNCPLVSVINGISSPGTAYYRDSIKYTLKCLKNYH